MLIQATAITLDDATLEKRGIAKVPGTTLKAYTLLHEGVSTPRHGITGEPLRLRWSRAVVRAVGGLVQAGLAFFRGHAPPNAPNRRAVGEVVGSWVQEIGGKLASVVVGRFPGSVDDLDVCSVEADVEWNGEEVTDVTGVRGIALANSRRDTPAFSDARALASVHCFIHATDSDVEEVAVGPKEIREWLQANPGFRVSNLVDEDRVMDDPGYHGIAKLKADLAERDSDLAASRKQVVRMSGAEMLRTKMDAGKYTKQARTFINREWAAHTDPQAKQEVIDQFIATKAKEFSDTYELPAVAADDKQETAPMANGKSPADNQSSLAAGQQANAAKAGEPTVQDMMKSVGISKETKAA